MLIGSQRKQQLIGGLTGLFALTLGSLVSQIQTDLSVILVSFLVLMLMLFVSDRVAGRFSLDLFSPQVLFPAAYAIWFIVGSVGISQHRSSTRITMNQWLLYGAGLASYLLAARIVSRMRTSSGVKRSQVLWNNGRYWSVLLVTFSVGAGSTILTYLVAGIPSLATGIAGEARFALESPLGPAWPYAFHLLQIVVFLSSLRLFTDQSMTGTKAGACAVLSLISVVLLALLGSRSFIMPLLLVPILFFHYYRHRLTILPVAATILAAVALNSGWDYSRLAADGVAESQAGYLDQVGLPANSPILGTLALTVQNGPKTFAVVQDYVPREIRHQQGAYLLGELLVFFPWRSLVLEHHWFGPDGRKLLPDHWVTSTLFSRDVRTVGGFPPTLLGGFYIDFGLPGILVGMAALGTIAAWLHRRAVDTLSPSYVVTYSLLLFYLLLSLYSHFVIRTIFIYEITLLVLAVRYLTSCPQGQELADQAPLPMQPAVAPATRCIGSTRALSRTIPWGYGRLRAFVTFRR